MSTNVSKLAQPGQSEFLEAVAELSGQQTLFAGPGGTRFAIMRGTMVLVKFGRYLDKSWRVRSAGAAA